MALFGGYENELVEPPPPELQQYECSICLQIIREPCMVSCCSLRFCHSCIEHIQRQRNPCPHCQKRRFTILPDTQLKRQLMHKRVYCIKKSAGCQWVGELRDAEKHVRVDCMWAEVACPNQCGQRFLRRMLNQHATEECPRHPRHCEFAAIGCDSEALTPNGLQDHMEESVQKHLTLVCKRLEETECHGALERSELEAMVLARDTKIRKLEIHAQTNRRVGELEAAEQVYVARVEELEAVVCAREERIAELETSVQVREARELEAKLQAQLAEVKELKARVKDRDARIRQLETKELESTADHEYEKATISELDTMVKVRDARIKKLSAEVQAHEMKLEKVEALLQDRDDQIRILGTGACSSETKVEALEIKLLAAKAAMNDFSIQLQACDGKIQSLEAAVEVRDAQIRQMIVMIQGLMLVASGILWSFIVMVIMMRRCLSLYKYNLLFIIIAAFLLKVFFHYYTPLYIFTSLGSNLIFLFTAVYIERCVNKSKIFF